MELTTERLQLRPVAEKDFDALYQIFTDANVRKYLCDDEIYSTEKIKSFLQMSISSFETNAFGLWLLEQTASHNIIGFAGLWYFFDEPQPQLIYALLPQYAGQGYATEASTAIIYYSFHQLHFTYLIASCDTPNTASHKVAVRLGMSQFKAEIHLGNPITFYRLESTHNNSTA